MAVGKHLMCCFFYSLSLTLSLSLSKKFQSFLYIISLSVSLSLKSCAFYLHIRLTSQPPPHSKAQQQEAPLTISPNKERDPFKIPTPKIPISSHTTQLKSLLNCISACSVIHTIQDLQLELDSIESDGVGNHCF